MAAMNGKWTVVSNDNLDAYINAMVKEERRAQAKINSQKHVMEIQGDGTNFTYTSTTPEATNTMSFTAGKEFDYILASGKKVKAVWTPVSDNKANVDFTAGDIKANLIVEISGAELTATITVGSIVTVSKYKKA